MTPARQAFEQWLIEERKALRLPGNTTSREEAAMWAAFRAGWVKSKRHILNSFDNKRESAL